MLHAESNRCCTVRNVNYNLHSHTYSILDRGTNRWNGLSYHRCWMEPYRISLLANIVRHRVLRRCPKLWWPHWCHLNDIINWYQWIKNCLDRELHQSAWSLTGWDVEMSLGGHLQQIETTLSLVCTFQEYPWHKRLDFNFDLFFADVRPETYWLCHLIVMFNVNRDRLIDRNRSISKPLE